MHTGVRMRKEDDTELFLKSYRLSKILGYNERKQHFDDFVNRQVTGGIRALIFFLI